MANSIIVATLVYNHLPRLSRELQTKASKVVRKAAEDIEAGAKAVVPVDTGTLKNSIQAEMQGDLAATVGTSVEYAAYVEMGTSRMAPRPYLTPAAEKVRPAFQVAMKKVIG